MSEVQTIVADAEADAKRAEAAVAAAVAQVKAAVKAKVVSIWAKVKPVLTHGGSLVLGYLAAHPAVSAVFATIWKWL